MKPPTQQQGFLVTEVTRFAVGITLTLAASLVVAGLDGCLLTLVKDDRLFGRAQDAINRFVIKSLLSSRQATSNAELDNLIEELRTIATES